MLKISWLHFLYYNLFMTGNIQYTAAEVFTTFFLDVIYSNKQKVALNVIFFTFSPSPAAIIVAVYPTNKPFVVP